MLAPASATLVRALAAVLAVFLLAGCGGAGDTMDATAEDVDESTSITITDQEYASFREPSDGVLTEAQVEMYLKTTLLQFDLVRKHSERLHDRFKQMEAREQKGGTMAGLRNLVDAGRTMYQMGDLIGGSYIRSARTLGYNPAELEWVRSQMVEVSGYLAMKPMYEAAAQSAQQMRAQAEELRQSLALAGEGALGFTELELKQMTDAAAEMEESVGTQEGSPSVRANAEVLRRARSEVTEPMWVSLGLTSGGTGLIALGGLGDPNDEDAQRKLDEFRQLFTDALQNRVTPGMERQEDGGW
jgi:hypothetical protein